MTVDQGARLEASLLNVQILRALILLCRDTKYGIGILFLQILIRGLLILRRQGGGSRIGYTQLNYGQ